MHPSSHGGAGGGLPGAYGPLASIAALLATVFLGPSVWPVIEAPVWSALSAQYGHQTAFWLAWAIRIASFPACYFVFRAALLAALIAFTAFTTKRLM